MESPVPFIISSHISPASSRPFPPATVLVSSSDIDPVGVPLLLFVPGVLVGRSPAYCYHFWKNASIFSNLSKIREAKSSSLFCSTRPTRLLGAATSVADSSSSSSSSSLGSPSPYVYATALAFCRGKDGPGRGGAAHNGGIPQSMSDKLFPGAN